MVKTVAHELTSPVLVELPDYAVLDATGSDAQSFLKGQFCNDLTDATASRAQLSGYCNPKGRLLSLFTVFAIEDGYRLVLHRDLLEASSKRLQMFVMRAEVKLEARDDLLCSGVILPPGESPVIKGLTMPLLPQVMDTETDAAGTWVRTGEVQFLFIAKADVQQTLFGADVEKVDANAWRLQNIRAGFPSLFAATVDKFVPQMINLQQAGGLSFTHGCYPGQEIVARMQYLGKLKRQMLRFSMEGSDAPPAGVSITASDDTEAGVVIDAVATDKGVQLLAVMNLAKLDEPFKVAGQALTTQALPYELSSVVK